MYAFCKTRVALHRRKPTSSLAHASASRVSYYMYAWMYDTGSRFTKRRTPVVTLDLRPAWNWTCVKFLDLDPFHYKAYLCARPKLNLRLAKVVVNFGVKFKYLIELLLLRISILTITYNCTICYVIIIHMK